MKAVFGDALQVAKQLPCGHLFHLPCLRAWLQQSGTDNFTCPICRTSLFLSHHDCLHKLPSATAHAAAQELAHSGSSSDDSAAPSAEALNTGEAAAGLFTDAASHENYSNSVSISGRSGSSDWDSDSYQIGNDDSAGSLRSWSSSQQARQGVGELFPGYWMLVNPFAKVQRLSLAQRRTCCACAAVAAAWKFQILTRWQSTTAAITICITKVSAASKRLLRLL